MTASEDLSDSIMAVESHAAWSAEWVLARDEATRLITTHLDRCIRWLHPSKLLVAEAIGHSESCGNLVALAHRLNATVSANNKGDTDESPVISQEDIGVLDQAYVVFRRSELKLASYRKATISRRSLGTRIARLSVLCNSKNARAWEGMFVDLLYSSGDQLAGELNRLARQGREDELKSIEQCLSTLSVNDQRVEKAHQQAKAVRHGAKRVSADNRRVHLLSLLHEAYSLLDEEQTAEILSEIDNLNSVSLPDEDQVILIEDARNWCALKLEEKQSLVAFNKRLEDLERSLDEESSRARLERLHSALLDYDESIPAGIEARYKAQIISTERSERARRRLLVSAAAVAVSISTVVVFILAANWRHERQVSQSSSEIILLAEAWELDTAEARLAELKVSAGDTKNVELSKAIAIVSTARLDRETADQTLRVLIDDGTTAREDGKDLQTLQEAMKP